MNSLSATSDFLAPHEEIVAVGVVRVVGVEHCVEWSGVGWVPVEHVKISVVLFPYDFSQSVLVNSAQVLKGSLLVTVFLQEGHGFLEVKTHHGGLALEGLKVVLVSHCLELFAKSGL